MGRADLTLLRELVSKVPWENASEGAGIHQYWSPPLRAQGQANPDKAEG